MLAADLCRRHRVLRQGGAAPAHVVCALVVGADPASARGTQRGRLADRLEAASRTDPARRRLRRIPGAGPVAEGAVAAFAPDLDTFDSGRNVAASLALAPRQRSTRGKVKLGSVSRMGPTDIQRLLILGAMSVIGWVVRKGGGPDRWLAAPDAREPKTGAAVALANTIACMIRAVVTKQDVPGMA